MSQKSRFCPECGSAVTGGFHFCPSCGIRLREAEPAAIGDAVAETRAAPPAAAAPEPSEPAESRKAERRLVSVMFVDLVGFTAMSERADPEDVREMQSRYFESARSTVARYGGSLEKFIGDAVMAVWGSPVARENDAERAVRASLELVRNVGSMSGGALLGDRLAARAAVTTGEAAVSFDIDGEGMVTGDMVNTASRLQEAAEGGTVLVDGATRRAIGVAGRFEAAGEKTLKGRAASVRAWRAVEVVTPERSEAAAGHRGPFVGRKPELSALLALAGSVVEDRRATLVSLIGVAGIGKSRLGHEVELRLKDTPGMRWYRGRPLRWGQGNAFAPLAEMVRRALGVTEADPAEVVRRTLGEALHRLIEDDAERGWIEPRVRALLDASDPVQAERDELFAAWRRYLEAEAGDGALVLEFEDLHWADAETLDFIEYLATWSRRHPIMVLTLGRPELLESRPTWGAGIPQFRAMHLDRLNDGEVDELLRALAPDLPAEAAARVRARAEGVPLYAVEIARMVTELVADGRGVVKGIEIPESLHALLAARIDALPGRERSVLLMASILGRRFRLKNLAALAGMDSRELGGIIGTLVRREFLVIDDEAGSPGRGQLSFVQDLTREIAYGTLSRRDRRSYHLAAIADLEAADDPEDVELIAEHLVAAHAAARPNEAEAASIAERTLGALQRAADHAAGLHAPHRALGHLERALGLASDPATRAGLAEAAAQAARAAARFATAEVHLREAIALRSSLGDAASAARDRANLASVLLQAQHSDTAVAELERAWEAYSASHEADPTLAHLAAELARAHMLLGDTDAAVQWAGRAIAAAEAAPGESAAFATDARVSLGTALAQAGKAEEGLEELRRASQDAVDGGLHEIQLRARTNVAWLTASDDPRAAAEIARDGLETARQVGSREWTLQLLDIAGFLSVQVGDWDWAIKALDDVAAADLPTAYRFDFAATRATIAALRGEGHALAPLEQLGEPEPDLDPHALGWAELARAVAATVAGRLDEGLRMAQSAAQRTVGLERAEALALAGRVAAWSGREDDAAAALEELRRERLWGRASEARVATLNAAVETLRHRPPGRRGEDPWASALKAWKDLGLRFPEALCRMDRSIIIGDGADMDAARRLLADLQADGLLALLEQRAALRSAAVPTGRPRRRRSSS